MVESHFLSYNKSNVHYVKAGRGKEVFIFFHGFGQDHSVYLSLVQSLSSNYTIYIIDLFFHGQSTWAHGEKPISKPEWHGLFSTFLQENSISEFSIGAFSLGARFALATTEAFVSKVKRLVLIAPDGIYENAWYRLAIGSLAMRRLLKSFIGRYERFLRIARWLEERKVVDANLLRFADYQMGTEEKRRRVYYSWVVFRKLRFQQKTLATIINQRKLRVVFVLGKHDPVIATSKIMKFAKRLNNYKVELLEAGHAGLIYRSGPYISHD